MPMRRGARAAGFVSADRARRGAFERAKASGAVNGAAGMARRDDIGSRQANPDATHTVSPPWGIDGVHGKRLNIICINLIFRARDPDMECRRDRHGTGLPAYFASLPAQLRQPAGIRAPGLPDLGTGAAGASGIPDSPAFGAAIRTDPEESAPRDRGLGLKLASALREGIGADLPRVALPSIAFPARQVFGQVYYGLTERLPAPFPPYG